MTFLIKLIMFLSQKVTMSCLFWLIRHGKAKISMNGTPRYFKEQEIDADEFTDWDEIK